MKYLLLILPLAIFGCASTSEDALYSAMKKNPTKFMQTLREVAEKAAQDDYKQMKGDRAAQREKDLKSPRPVAVDDSRLIFGTKDAPVTIVKYADFQCPACRVGYVTLEKIKKKYPTQIKMIHKNIPLPMHPQAPLAAEIFEANLILDKTLAKKFYSELYEKQGQWASDEKVWEIAKKVGISKEKTLKELKKGTVAKRIQEDLDEHEKLGFNGTPMYMINGVEMQGAPSEADLTALIEQILKK